MKLFTKEVDKVLDKYPYLSQEGKGMDAKVVARFFGGSAYTCYILEHDTFDRLFGLVSMGYGFEYGYVSRSELENIRFPPFGLPLERDRSIEPGKHTLGECMHMYNESLETL